MECITDITVKIRLTKSLQTDALYSDTEGYILAIQDGVIQTRNYKRRILGYCEVDDVCRRCGQPHGIIDGIITAWGSIRGNDFLRCHEVAEILHIQQCKNTD